MLLFVNWLKTFATIFITNAHYADIWPIQALAHGGHLGNCLFFLLSGFCLYNIRDSFPRWYLKRAIRIYPALWMVVAVDLLADRIGLGTLGAVFRCCIYPTWYHFITSIMILYVVFYGVRLLQKKTGISMGKVTVTAFALCMAVYIFIFDRSYYHIDHAGEMWVRGQFLISMLLGALLRENYHRVDEKISGGLMIAIPACLLGYLAMKLGVNRCPLLLQLQCLIQIFLVGAVFSLAVLGVKLEKRGFFAGLPGWMNRLTAFLSGITLEIYLGQELILWKFESLPFPVDFFVVTGLIVLYAWLLHKCAGAVADRMGKLLKL